MKKHELLEKAMRDYPAGTNYISPFSGTKFTSKGVFVLHMKGVVEIGEGEIFDGDKWAQIIPSEPIKFEHVAVKVSSRREAEIIAKHYNQKIGVTAWIGSLECVAYIGHSEFEYDRIEDVDDRYTIIDFDFWAVQNNIQIPKPILRSEDGVDLYEGDQHHVVSWLARGEWWYNCSQKLKSLQIVVTEPFENKAFASKEAAEAWIEKNNKPAFKDVPLFKQGNKAVVFKDRIEIHDNIDGGHTILSPSDIEDILQAYNSLH